MSLLTLFLYLAALGLWTWCTAREGGIGIGVRFLYAFGLFHQYLIGPPLYFLSGLSEAHVEYRNREQAVQLVLAGLAAFVAGGFFVPPLLLQRRRLRMARDWAPFTSPARLALQWHVAKTLVLLGAVALLFAPILFRINTVRAVWLQVTLLVETGLVMMCVHAVLARDQRRLRVVFTVLVAAGIFRAIASGFFGGTAMTGLYLCSLIFMMRGISLKGWLYLGLALYLMLIPYGIWISGRQKLRDAIKTNASLTERVQAFELRDEAPLFFNLFDPEDVKKIQRRIDQSNLLAAAMVHTPARQPYAMGSTMSENVLYALVPRFLWPDKPVKAGGAEFVTRYTGIPFQNTSVGVNYLFEFYVNFGPTGAVAGLFLLGVACGLLEYQFFARAPRSFAFEWTTILCTWTVCVHTDLMSQLAMTLPVDLFVGWGLGWLFQETGWAPVYFVGRLFPPRPPLPRGEGRAAAVPGPGPAGHNGHP
jgi:hypothetical protein